MTVATVLELHAAQPKPLLWAAKLQSVLPGGRIPRALLLNHLSKVDA